MCTQNLGLGSTDQTLFIFSTLGSFCVFTLQGYFGVKVQVYGPLGTCLD